MADQQKESVSDSQELLVDDDGLLEPDHTFGRYRFERSLGSGAMATVLLATDTVLGRKVALKVPLIRPEANDRDIQKRFLREAKAAARLSHPNICQIHDVGVVENSLYISMAYIEGISLMQVIDETEKFTEKEIAHLVRGIASAVAEAHSQGVLHRDLKPGNIMIDRRGEPVVLDFGLASFFTKNEDSLMTLEGHALGTPSYMSPEQATNEQELTPATDIYSLGVILWELITGERLYSGETMQILGQIVHGEMIKPSSKRPGVSPDLEAICLKALAKRPSERFRSMDEFVLAVEGWLQLRGVNVLGDSGSGILIESQTEISVPDFEAVLDQTRHEIEVVSRMREQRWMYVIAFLAGIIGLLLYLLWGQSHGLPDTVNANAVDSELTATRPPDGRFNEGTFDFRLDPPRPGMSVDELFSTYDTDQNERLDPNEFPRHIIRRADTNNDDLLNKQELQTGFDQFGPGDLMRPPSGQRPPNGQRPGERPRPNPPPPPRDRF